MFDCPKNSTCVNLEGDYRCDCDPGYTKDDDRCIGRNIVHCNEKLIGSNVKKIIALICQSCLTVIISHEYM